MGDISLEDVKNENVDLVSNNLFFVFSHIFLVFESGFFVVSGTDSCGGSF